MFSNYISAPVLLFMCSIAMSAWAGCENQATPSCAVYQSCFAKYCSCKDSEDEYFNRYGAKYCKVFLENISFSDSGKAWRDSTLRCLQESIVPRLDLNNPSACDCKAMKDFAYKSHVSCYTSADHSICDLPLSDVYNIYRAVNIKDALSSEGWKQMHTVSAICSKTSSEDGRRSLWKTIELILSLR
ncbi:hypothetical protein D3C84_482910 [compost metagenome]